MNHCYRLVFNAAAQVWQAVAETAKSQRKSGQAKLGKSKMLVLASVLLASNVYAELGVDALPTGGQVVSGQSVISQSGNQLNILQTTQKSIINWGSYNIGANSTVNYEQLNSSSISLNRILSSDPSQIFGKLNANGQVWLINPNGILFGKSAQVNVGGLLASTLNIADDDFLSGNYKFTGNTGSVTNMGSIVANSSGYVAMLAPEVRNEGIISALEGASILAAGDAITMNFAGNGLINVQVDSANVNTLVENKHLIKVGGGQVIMSSKAADGLITSVINNSGRIEADSMVADGGTVRLTGAKTTINSGDISAQSSAAKGGNVQLLGEHVGIFDNGSINVNGKTGGGTILVGGDYQGKNTNIKNANKTFISQNAKLSADATDAGDGGKVIVWADDITRFYGNISAKGGTAAGNGGFVEVSGKRYLDFIGQVDTTAKYGSMGMLLLDPTDITISTGANSIESTGATTFQETTPTATSILNTTTLQNALALNNVTVTTASAAAGTGNITVNNTVTWASGRTLTLLAENNLTVAAAITTTGAGGVVLRADSDNTSTGTLAINAAIATDIGGATLSGASVTSTAAGTINTTGAANANGGNVSITATGAVNLAGAITSTGGTAAANTTGRNAGTVNISGASVQTAAITANGSNGNGANQAGGNAAAITLTAATGNVTSTGALTARTGSATGTGASGATTTVSATGANVTLAAVNVSGQNKGNGGNIAATATGVLTLNGALNTNGGTTITGNAGRNAGNINLSGNTITAVAAGTITANGSNGLGANQAGGNAGTVTINGAGAFSLRAITASGGNGIAANGGGGNAGVINISSSAGAVNMNGTTLTARNGTAFGTGTAGAAGSVSVAGTAVTLGAVTTAGNSKGNGGSVTATASTGALTLNGAINSGGGAGVAGTVGGNAGAVSLTGNSIASAAAGTVTASGGTGGTNAGGGTGAAVTINSTNNANLQAITASGGAGTAASGAGGAAGSINITSSAGVVNTNSAALTARTGAASGAGASGAAGSIIVTGAGLTLGAINTSRGSTSGTGGNVNVTTTGAATSTVASINADSAGAVNMIVADTLTVSGVIAGTNSVLTKTGTGKLVLSGANTYTGATNINVGTLRANNAAALGAAGGGTTVANGATLNVNNVTLAESALTINGIGVGGAGALTGTGTANVSGTLATASDSRIGTTSAASTLDITGVVTAANNLGIVGAGNVTATNAANNFSTVNINGANNVSLRDANGIILGNGASNLTGTLGLTTAGAITQTADITVGGATTLNAGVGNDITLNNAANNFSTVAATGRNVSLVDANALTINASNVTTIVAQTLSGNLTLGGNIAATGAGDAIVLASAANFINATNSTLAPGTGRWLVYSTNPDLDTRGDLLTASDFKQYNTTFGGSILGINDGFIYSLAPTITPTLTGTATKTYNGTLAAPVGSLALGQSGTIDGDTVVLGALTSATYDTANAGTGKTVSASGISIASQANGAKPVYGYSLASTTASGAVGTINQANITVSTNNVVKTYDGLTTAAGVANLTSGSLFNNASNGGAADTLFGGAFAYTDANAGVGNKTVTVAGITVNDGNGGGNYNVTFANNTTSTINTANLTVTANNQTKTYGNTFTFAGTEFTSTGLQNGETIGSAALASAGAVNTANVGSYSITTSAATGGTFNAANYAITYVNGTMIVDPATINLSGTRTYNGTTAFNPADFGTINGLLGQILNLTGTGSVSSANAGAAQTLTTGSLALANGTGLASNYTLTGGTHTGTINQSNLTISTSDVTKTYDGSLAAAGTATVTSGTLFTNASNGGAADTIGGGTFAFTNANAGIGNKTVTTTGVTVTDGNGGGNYNVTYADNTTSTINKANLTVSTSDVIKIYDGTTTAAGTATVTSGTLYNNASNGNALDNLSGGSFAFTDKNFGIGNKTVTVAGVTVNDGNGGGNYDMLYANNTTSTINKAALALNAVTDTKTYDGNTSSAGVVGIVGLQIGDSVTAVQSFDNKNAGSRTLAVNAGYAVNDGNSGSNYTVTTNTAAGTIDPKALTVTANSQTKTYGQTVNFAGTEFTSAGLVIGETIGSASLASAGAVNTANVAGSAYAITASGATGGTFDANNYAINYVDGSLTVNRAALTVAANNATKTQGSPNPVFGSTITGFVNGETSAVLIGALNHSTPAVTSSPAGFYAITPFGLAADNYTIAFVDGVLTVGRPANISVLSGALTRPQQAQQTCGGEAVNNNAMISGLDTFGVDDVEYKESVSQPLVGGVVANALVSPSCLRL